MRLSEKEREQKAAEAGKTILQFASGAAAAALGPDAAMRKDEQMAIEGPLSRLLERLEPAVLESISTMTDPLALFLAVAFWLGRVASIARDRATKREAEVKATGVAHVDREKFLAPEKGVPAPASAKTIEQAMPVQPDGRLQLRSLKKGELERDLVALP